MKYTSFRVGLKRTVNLGDYESATFDLSLTVDLGDELDVDELGAEVPGTGGLDPSNPLERAALAERVQTAYRDAAALLTAERQRRLKSPEDQVTVEEKRAGKPIVDIGAARKG